VNKYLLLLIGIIVLSSVVHADDYSDGKYLYTANNILRPGWNDFLNIATLGFGHASDVDTVPGMFGYSLKGWEVSVCSQAVTSDLSYQPPNGFSGISTDLSKIYDTSATISATKISYGENQTLIEVFWYIQPKAGEVEYNVYLVKGSNKLPIASSKSDSAQGETGYTADYYPVNYTQAVMVYKDGTEILRVDIANKK
jgi:hypothetical protein